MLMNVTVLMLKFVETDLVAIVVTASQDTKEEMLIANVNVRILRIHPLRHNINLYY